MWFVDFNVDTLNHVCISALRAKIKPSQVTKEANKRRKEEKRRVGEHGRICIACNIPMYENVLNNTVPCAINIDNDD